MKVSANDQNFSTYVTHDLIMHYKNNQWYGVSPNGRFSNWLSDNSVDSLPIVDSGDSIWVYSLSNSKNIEINEFSSNSNEVILKAGWNQVSVSNMTSYFDIDIKSFFTSSDIKSLWIFNNNTQKWSAFSYDSTEESVIKNSAEIEWIETVGSWEPFFIYSNIDTTITFPNKAPFITLNGTQLESDFNSALHEKDMAQFSISAIDPNGDNISFTIDGADKDYFKLENNEVKFKVSNTKPTKTSFTFNVTASDGVLSDKKYFTIPSITLRTENTYSGPYDDNVGYDSSEDVEKQWYLDQLGITALHNNGIDGSNTRPVIQVVEGGFDTRHNDLVANLDFSMGYDFHESIDSSFTNIANMHGTAVAGIIAARGYNGIGVRGIAPFARLTGHKFALDYITDDVFLLNVSDENSLRLAWQDGPRANDIDISNNSWGQCYNYSVSESKYMEFGANNLRDGKGRIYVMAAGNNRNSSSYCGDGMASTNLNIHMNNPYVITVGAMYSDDIVQVTSTPGASILVSAYGYSRGEPYMWSTNINNAYNDHGVSSTSAASAMVSGATALLLDECPNLTYRDVKYLIATTANKIDSGNSSWITNGVGFDYSTDYGFGKLDITEAINTCTGVYSNLGTQSTFEQTETFDQTVNTSGSTTTFNIDATFNKKVEWVGVQFEGELQNIKDFSFILESPLGTQIELLHSGLINAEDLDSTFGIDDNNKIFRLSSVGFLNENANGTWKVKIKKEQNIGDQAFKTINKLKLEIYGY